MNMLSSLKALLFASTPMSGPGEGVVPGAAAAASGAPDFAQLLNASMGEGGSAEGQPLPVGGNFVPQEADLEAGEPMGRALGRTDAMPLPPGLALGVVKHRAVEPSPARERPQPEAPQDEALEVVAITSLPVQQVGVDPEAVDAPVVEQPVVKSGSKGVTVQPELKLNVAKAEVAPVEQRVCPAGDEDEQSDAAPERPEGGHAPMLASSPVFAAVEASPPVVLPAEAPPPVEGRPAAADGKAEAVSMGKARPEGKTKAAVAQAPVAAEKSAAEASELVVPVPPHPIAEAPRVVSAPSRRATQPLAAPESEAKVEGAALPTPPDFAQSVIKSGEQPMIAPVLNGKPVKAEAAALLQIVRDQVAAKQSGDAVKVDEAVATAAHARRETPVAAPDPVTAAPTIVAEPTAPSAPSAPVTAPPPVAPTVDLSASLGARVVDMGVSGQWIDGLARDVAGLSANGAQGRFQIHSDQLGAVQVDIRHGGEGAAVSLTVANEAAELALKQDSERLKIDAGLASVRIAEVKVERAPMAEAARADSAGQQSQQQSSHHSQAQNQSAWANGNQNMGQPQGQQGRWQTRENNGLSPKSSGDPAVLNHAEARQDAGENRRTRYA